MVDIPSKRTLVTLPAQNELTWLSPDERTWVTTSQYVINIWDFPPRKGFLAPLFWSLLAPAFVMLCQYMWRLLRMVIARLTLRRPRTKVPV